MTRPGASQHVRVLREVGLVRDRQAGKQRLYAHDACGSMPLTPAVRGPSTSGPAIRAGTPSRPYVRRRAPWPPTSSRPLARGRRALTPSGSGDAASGSIAFRPSACVHARPYGARRTDVTIQPTPSESAPGATAPPTRGERAIPRSPRRPAASGGPFAADPPAGQIPECRVRAASRRSPAAWGSCRFSEPLRIQESQGEIPEQGHGHDEADDVFGGHGPVTAARAMRATGASTAVVVATKARSTIVSS